MSKKRQFLFIASLVILFLVACGSSAEIEEEPESTLTPTPDGGVPGPDVSSTDDDEGQDEIPVDYLVSVLGLEFGVEYEIQLFDMDGNIVNGNTFVIEPNGNGLAVPTNALKAGEAKIVARDIESGQIYEHDLIVASVLMGSEEIEIGGEIFNLNEFDRALITEVNAVGIEEGNQLMIIDMEQIIEIQE